MKYKIIVILSIFFMSFSTSEKVDDYRQALSKITTSKEYHSFTKNQKKYYVSNEVIRYTKLAQYFKKELQQYNELTDEEIVLNTYKDNLNNDNLLTLNIKKCSKVQINFSEIREGIFFAELIKTKKKLKYKDVYFGISYVYMFKKNLNDKIELINVIQLDNN